jgi:selenocysteine lyase/cysteine desulfurase
MDIPSVQLYGVDFSTSHRAPTISFIVENKTAAGVCKLLGEQGIFAWDGHFYALRASEILGTLDKGGVIRMGVVAYNTAEEIDRVIDVVGSIAKLSTFNVQH